MVEIKLQHPGITYDTPCCYCGKPTIWTAWIPSEFGWAGVCNNGKCARLAAVKPTIDR